MAKSTKKPGLVVLIDGEPPPLLKKARDEALREAAKHGALSLRHSREPYWQQLRALLKLKKISIRSVIALDMLGVAQNLEEGIIELSSGEEFLVQYHWCEMEQTGEVVRFESHIEGRDD